MIRLLMTALIGLLVVALASVDVLDIGGFAIRWHWTSSEKWTGVSA